jgi:hypothetical protein
MVLASLSRIPSWTSTSSKITQMHLRIKQSSAFSGVDLCSTKMVFTYATKEMLAAGSSQALLKDRTVAPTHKSVVNAVRTKLILSFACLSNLRSLLAPTTRVNRVDGLVTSVW